MTRMLTFTLSLGVACLNLALILGLSATFGLITWLPTIVAALLCGLSAAMFAYLTPTGSWQWGLIVSSACWLFLGITFVSLWTLDSFSWWPFIDAVVVSIVACAGGTLGRRLAM